MNAVPDRRAVLGPYRVDLWRGFWGMRSEVVIWKNVWPALGGLISRRKVRNREADACFESTVAVMVEETGLSVQSLSRTDWVRR